MFQRVRYASAVTQRARTVDGTTTTRPSAPSIARCSGTAPTRPPLNYSSPPTPRGLILCTTTLSRTRVSTVCNSDPRAAVRVGPGVPRRTTHGTQLLLARHSLLQLLYAFYSGSRFYGYSCPNRAVSCRRTPCGQIHYDSFIKSSKCRL